VGDGSLWNTYGTENQKIMLSTLWPKDARNNIEMLMPASFISCGKICRDRQYAGRVEAPAIRN